MSIDFYQGFIERHFPDCAGRLALVDLSAPPPKDKLDAFIAAQITARDDPKNKPRNGRLALTDNNLNTATCHFYEDSRDAVKSRHHLYKNRRPHFAPIKWIDKDGNVCLMQAAGVIAYPEHPINRKKAMYGGMRFSPYPRNQKTINVGRIFLHELFHAVRSLRDVKFKPPFAHTDEVGADSFAYCVLEIMDFPGRQEHFNAVAAYRLVNGFQCDPVHTTTRGLQRLLAMKKSDLPGTVADAFDFAVAHAETCRIFTSDKELATAQKNIVVLPDDSAKTKSARRYRAIRRTGLGTFRQDYERIVRTACANDREFFDVSHDIHAIHDRIARRNDKKSNKHKKPKHDARSLKNS